MLKLLLLSSLLVPPVNSGVISNIKDVFTAVERDNGIPEGLLDALCYIESHHKPKAINQYDNGSPSFGTCQLKRATAEYIVSIIRYKEYNEIWLIDKGVCSIKKDELDCTINRRKLLNYHINIELAGKYLRYQYNEYNSWTHAIAAYNAGSLKLKGNVARNIKYVRKVEAVYLNNVKKKLN